MWVDLENSGQTPGYEFTTWLKVRIDVPDADPFSDEMPIAKRTGRSIIGPKAKAHISLTHGLSPAELDDLNKGTKKVFVWGGADYMDAFSKARTFKFRSVNGTRQRDGGWSLQPHPVGYVGN